MALRNHAELAGIRVSSKRLAQLMRMMGVAGVSRRQQADTTVRDRALIRHPIFAERTFATASHDRLWVADITDTPSWAGFLHLAAVLNA